MNKYDVRRLMNRGKLVLSFLVLGGFAAFCVFNLYGAWAYGTVGTRRAGVVSFLDRPDALWFSVTVQVAFLIFLVAGAAFFVWAGKLGRFPKSRHPPMVDTSRIRPFDE